MKRDPELVRKLLIFFEDKADCELIEAKAIHIDDYDSATIQYHLDLMYEAGFLNGEPVWTERTERLIYFLPFRLTWKGHEFLDAARNETIWKKAKEVLGTESLTLSFESLYQLLVRLASEALK